MWFMSMNGVAFAASFRHFDSCAKCTFAPPRTKKGPFAHKSK